MRLISSKATGFYKLVASVVVLGLALGALLFVVTWPSRPGRFNIFDGLFPLALAIFCYLTYTMVITGFMDAVWDDGQSLLVRRGGKEAWIDLKDIESASYSMMKIRQR